MSLLLTACLIGYRYSLLPPFSRLVQQRLVNICDGIVDNIQNGRAVKLDNTDAVCEFSANNTPYLNTAFSNMSDTEEQAAALSAVADFIASAKSKTPILSPANE